MVCSLLRRRVGAVVELRDREARLRRVGREALLLARRARRRRAPAPPAAARGSARPRAASAPRMRWSARRCAAAKRSKRAGSSCCACAERGVAPRASASSASIAAQVLLRLPQPRGRVLLRQLPGQRAGGAGARARARASASASCRPALRASPARASRRSSRSRSLRVGEGHAVGSVLRRARARPRAASRRFCSASRSIVAGLARAPAAGARRRPCGGSPACRRRRRACPASPAGCCARKRRSRKFLNASWNSCCASTCARWPPCGISGSSRDVPEPAHLLARVALEQAGRAACRRGSRRSIRRAPSLSRSKAAIASL